MESCCMLAKSCVMINHSLLCAVFARAREGKPKCRHETHAHSQLDFITIAWLFLCPFTIYKAIYSQ